MNNIGYFKSMMRGRLSKWAVLSTLGAMILLGIILLLVVNSGFAQCSRIITKSLRSPGNGLIVVQYERLCPIGGGASTDLSLIDSSFWLQFPSSLIPFTVVDGRHNLNVEWSAGKEIKVTLPKNTKIYVQDRDANGVSVQYLEQ